MCLAIPGEVIAVHERYGLRFAAVRFGAVRRDVCIEYHPDARPGDWVLVHVGVAIARIDEAEAARAWRALEELGAVEDALREAGAEEGS